MKVSGLIEDSLKETLKVALALPKNKTPCVKVGDVIKQRLSKDWIKSESNWAKCYSSRVAYEMSSKVYSTLATFPLLDITHIKPEKSIFDIGFVTQNINDYVSSIIESLDSEQDIILASPTVITLLQTSENSTMQSATEGDILEDPILLYDFSKLQGRVILDDKEIPVVSLLDIFIEVLIVQKNAFHISIDNISVKETDENFEIEVSYTIYVNESISPRVIFAN